MAPGSARLPDPGPAKAGDLEPLGGLHHVTAITGDAPANLDFYTRVLGMRLVKRTVNQDDVSAYHLFYADGLGSPGTDLTFFDWPQTPPARPGAGSIGPVALRVASPEAIEWWQGTLRAAGVADAKVGLREGHSLLSFSDPEGQRLELVSDDGVPGGVAWEPSPVPARFQLKGLHGVTLTSTRPEITEAVLTRLLGFRRTADRELAATGDETGQDAGLEKVFEVGAGGPGTEVRLRVPRAGEPGRQGRGGVHHVAFRVGDASAQEDWRERLLAAGLQPTPVIDRFYFKSVYFREPGGVLFELATDGPGFAADEPEATMGTRLALPPFLEPDRRRIEAGLAPLA